MTKYISYFIAKELLKSQLIATPDEIAEWVSYGKENGGLNAYTIRKFDDEPEPFIFGSQKFINAAQKAKKDDNISLDDYISPLQSLWFLRNDIEQFNPNKRYITRKALIERWTLQCGGEVQAKRFIRDEADNLRLPEDHPIVGAVESAGELFSMRDFYVNQALIITC